MTEHATFTDWIRRGRQVRKGERAAIYAVNPDPDSTSDIDQRLGTSKLRAALFSIEQTDPYIESDYYADWPLVAAEDLPPKDTDKRKKLTLKLTADGYVTAWCGPDKYMIDLFKRKHWVFDSKTAYWVAPHKDLERTRAALEAEGYNVRIPE